MKLLKGITLTLMMASMMACSSSEFGIPDQQESFDAVASYNNKVDILFMIDNSSSMLVYQQRLGQQVDQLVDSLNQKNLDYRIAAVSSDLRSGGTGGRLLGNPSFVTRFTPGMRDLLRQRLVIGQAGSDIESGLGSLRQSLGSVSAESFLRSDAILAIVVLTNEDDYSLGSVNDYVSFFDELKVGVPGSTRGWMFNFIGVVTIDGNCRTTADFKEAGLRYMALADLSGGISSSICETDLSRAVANVEKRIVQVLSEFKLRVPPLVETIRVFINGVEIFEDASNGWTYNSDRNTIVFHGNALPGASDRVSVDFSPAGGS